MYEVVYRERAGWDGMTYHVRQCPDLQRSVDSVVYVERELRGRGFEVVAVREGVDALPR